MTAESILSTCIASDGDNVVVQDWPLDPAVKLRGVVIVVHGLGEHAGRYDHMAQQLNAWGFAVRGYDQCGHGESNGARANASGFPNEHAAIFIVRVRYDERQAGAGTNFTEDAGHAGRTPVRRNGHGIVLSQRKTGNRDDGEGDQDARVTGWFHIVLEPL